MQVPLGFPPTIVPARGKATATATPKLAPFKGERLIIPSEQSPGIVLERVVVEMHGSSFLEPQEMLKNPVPAGALNEGAFHCKVGCDLLDIGQTVTLHFHNTTEFPVTVSPVWLGQTA